jgi:peptide/nickel transport system permease protein
VAGTALGMVAAYAGGRTDAIVMRGVDVLLAFPQLVLALLLVSILGPQTWLLIVAVALGHMPQVARVMRAASLDVCEREFVKAAELNRLPARRILTREVLPSLTGPLMVESGLRLTYSIVVIAGLSFIGFGLQPPDPNWGTMINENYPGLTENIWAVGVPCALLAILTIGINTFTDSVARVSLGVDRARDVLAIATAPPEP